ncbi:phosphomannomutase/phosphoglucomutase [Thioflexithrix psekupsensis]|uniref:phosphomannomutase n=1 Tax=Thioflexithrix psekupsensis TaxID=1570016 RepID=A0A251X5Z9_9GAMM|nr:phosphomannomutase/phosphoglucomutase [Thioflexithrix psekupsensis]OUD12528.1 phosphomannomutase/phosphoglucomutase [Thioflexithrix psekupsensis]
MSIFRAYDIRGIVGETLTPELVCQIGQAIGSEAAKQQQAEVVIARDGRLSGAALSQALSEGLQAAGRKVIDIGMVPTPVLYFATYHLNTGSGVMLTGSHNPPNYNGMKMMIGGDTLFDQAIQQLKQRIDNGDLMQGFGDYQTLDLKQAYIERICGDVKLKRPFKLVIDCGSGVAGAIAPQLFRQLGCEVIELYCEVDGHFPHHHPDPSKPENLHDLIAAVKTHRADLGFAFDGDGDRLGVVDATGQIIWPDRQMILYARDVLSRNPNAAIIYDVKCSQHLTDAIIAAGGQAIMWKTGHSFIKTKIKTSGAALGGEMSGHIFFKERWYGFDDALYTGARLLEILSQDSRSPTAVFKELPDAVNTPELNLNTAEGENFILMDKIRAHFTFDQAEIVTIDGLRANFATGWGLVRASNTTPCLVLRFEADTAEDLAAIQEQFRAQFKQIDAHLALPF